MQCIWSGQLGFNNWIYFAPVFSWFTVESLSLFYLLFHILLCMYLEMIHR